MFKRSMYVVCDKVSRNCGAVMEFENEATLHRWLKKAYSNSPDLRDYLRDIVVYKVGELCIINGVPTCKPCQSEIVLRGDDLIDCTSEANSDASDCDAV